MSFGLRDSDWVNPPDPPAYDGTCECCARFTACPCGCGWGFCDDDPGELFYGSEGGCEEGTPL